MTRVAFIALITLDDDIAVDADARVVRQRVQDAIGQTGAVVSSIDEWWEWPIPHDEKVLEEL